jgi:hypothetical protein
MPETNPGVNNYGAFSQSSLWSHLLTGVTAGLVILIMSVTGLLLTYERQITWWADTRSYQVTPPTPAAPRLPIDTLLAKAGEARPNVALTTVTLRAETSAPAAIGLAGGRAIFIDPYTGQVLGEGANSVRDFFHVIIRRAGRSSVYGSRIQLRRPRPLPSIMGMAVSRKSARNSPLSEAMVRS